MSQTVQFSKCRTQSKMEPAQYLLHNVTYAPVNFEVDMSYG